MGKNRRGREARLGLFLFLSLSLSLCASVCGTSAPASPWDRLAAGAAAGAAAAAAAAAAVVVVAVVVAVVVVATWPHLRLGGAPPTAGLKVTRRGPKAPRRWLALAFVFFAAAAAVFFFFRFECFFFGTRTLVGPYWPVSITFDPVGSGSEGRHRLLPGFTEFYRVFLLDSLFLVLPVLVFHVKTKYSAVSVVENTFHYVGPSWIEF